MAKTWLPHLKVTLGGALGNNNGGAGDGSSLEIWSCGFRYFSPTLENAPPTVVAMQSASNNMIGKAVTWFAAAASEISSTASLQTLKLVWILNTGKQRDVNTIVQDAPIGTVGGITGLSPIWEQTYALTFRTRVSRGRGHSGRVYPPLSGPQPLAGTPYCAVADATGMAASMATLLNNWTTDIRAGIPSSNDGTFAVMSAGDTTPPGLDPLATPITGVVCDRVADIQHRRTNRVPRSEGASSPIAT